LAFNEVQSLTAFLPSGRFKDGVSCHQPYSNGKNETFRQQSPLNFDESAIVFGSVSAIRPNPENSRKEYRRTDEN
jgi:hypothetical protein